MIAYFIIDKTSLYVIDLSSENKKVTKLWDIKDSKANLYGLGILAGIDAVAVTNAKDYQNMGELYIFKSRNFASPFTALKTSLNPSQIVN